MSIFTKRWSRIKTLGININFVKSIINSEFGYEINETSINEFVENIDNYKDIDQQKLLNDLEKNCYRKLSILSMRPLKRGVEYPVYEELTNLVFNHEFKMKNRISRQVGREVVDSLDECFKVTYYKENEDYTEIKLARLYKYIESNNNPEMMIDTEIEIYDFYKIIIDLDKKLIFMFYNDLPNHMNDYTFKKKAFYQLFSNATKGNILSYIISDSLTNYFLEYMDEIENNNIKKAISLLETESIIGSKKATRSVAHEYQHDQCTLNAIKELVVSKGHCIQTLECKLCSQLIKLKSTGDVYLETNLFNKEVLESVCKEFLGGHMLYRYCYQ